MDTHISELTREEDPAESRAAHPESPCRAKRAPGSRRMIRRLNLRCWTTLSRRQPHWIRLPSGSSLPLSRFAAPDAPGC